MKDAPADAAASAGARRYSNPVDLGQRIQRLRQARGLTQRDLAGERYTAAYVSSVESGRRSPSGEALRHFAEKLEISFAELATGRPADNLEATFTAALGSEPAAFSRIAKDAAALGENRWHAWALLEIDPVAHLDEVARLLEDESALDRLPLVLARAAVAESRYALYLLEQARDELAREGLPDPDARHALHAHLAAHYLSLGDEQRAAAAAREALSLNGITAFSGYLETATTLLSARKPREASVYFGQARAAFRRAAQLPVLAAAYRARGLEHRDADRLEAAAADLTRAREIYGDSDSGLDTAVELAEVQRRRTLPAAATELLSLILPELAHSAVSRDGTARPSAREGRPEDGAASEIGPARTDRASKTSGDRHGAGATTGPGRYIGDAAGEHRSAAGAGDKAGQRGRAADVGGQGHNAATAGDPIRRSGKAGTRKRQSAEAKLPLRVAHARFEAAMLALDEGDSVAAERFLRDAIDQYRIAGPRKQLARAISALGTVLTGQNRLEEAAEVLHEGLLRLESLIRG